MRTLILVDLQNDFLPGGALAVAEGDAVVPVANRLMPTFDLVVATQDWHPADHGSFAAGHAGRKPGEFIDLHGLRQVLWPVHCVQRTAGASFASELDISHIDHVIRKGTDPAIDSYSAFFDNGHRKGTGLHELLTHRHADELFVLGLATDYCVKFTVLDALQLGYRVCVIEDGCRGVDLSAGDVSRAIDEMRNRGARIIKSHDAVPAL